MNHYVYQITYNTGKKYVGVRSCKCSIEADPYMGSAFHLPEGLIGCKEVLSTHSTRQAAMEEEIRLHKQLDVKNNPEYYNQCNATSTKFQVSKEAIERGAKTRTGRTKETHEYIAKQVAARSGYKGKGLTVAQKAQWSAERMQERMEKYRKTLEKTMQDETRAKAIQEARIRGGKSCKGIPNAKKAHIGLAHPRAVRWWYTTPEGHTVIVNDSIRNYCINHSELPVSAASIMRYLRENKVPNKVKQLGWNFGHIHELGITNLVE